MNNPRKSRVLISCGPMRTAIDPARFLQNRSSGKMGLALAKAARQTGAEVTVLLGPVSDDSARSFEGFTMVRYATPDDYGRSLASLFTQCDVFISAAAVLDFYVEYSETKHDRRTLFGNTNALTAELTIPIRAVPDYVALCAREKEPAQKVIAFAAEAGEEQYCLTHGHAKLVSKGADAILINRITDDTGPETDTNEIWLTLPDGKTHALGKTSKTELGARVWDALQLHVLDRYTDEK